MSLEGNGSDQKTTLRAVRQDRWPDEALGDGNRLVEMPDKTEHIEVAKTEGQERMKLKIERIMKQI